MDTGRLWGRLNRAAEAVAGPLPLGLSSRPEPPSGPRGRRRHRGRAPPRGALGPCWRAVYVQEVLEHSAGILSGAVDLVETWRVEARRRWTMGHGGWGVGHGGRRRTGHGGCGMENGAWGMQHGGRGMGHGAWGVATECLGTPLCILLATALPYSALAHCHTAALPPCRPTALPPYRPAALPHRCAAP